MKTSTIAVIVLVLVAVGLGWWLYAKAPTTPATQTPTDQGMPDSGVTGATSTPATAASFTAAQVATHNNAQSCYTIIDNNVYDLTKWIPQHPGGQQAILGLCGHDGSAAFHGQHDDAKRQADILATFKIGALAQ